MLLTASTERRFFAFNEILLTTLEQILLYVALSAYQEVYALDVKHN